MKNPALVYVTGNSYKLFTAQKFLKPFGVEVIGKKIPCPEIQADTIDEVAKFSAEYAANKLGCPVLKNDMGLVIPALNGFPAAYTHYVEDTLTEDGILKLMTGVQNREAYFHECLAYAVPGKETKIFVSITKGKLATEKSGKYGWSWDRIFIPDGQKETMAHFDDEKRADFWSDEGYSALAQHINSQN